jgi:hypothetical protein
MRAIVAVSLVVVMLWVGGGCATVFSSSTQQVQMTSTPPGAEVMIDGVPIGRTPMIATLHKNKAYLVSFRSGNQVTTCTLTKSVGAVWIVLDILFGFVPLIVDAITGDWYSLDQSQCHGYFSGGGGRGHY